MFGDGFGEDAGSVIKGRVPIGAAAGQALAEAQFRIQRSGREVTGQVQGRTLAAQFAEVGRVGRIAVDAEDALAVMLDQHAAADSAIAAGGGGDLAVHQLASFKVSPNIR
ncbi:hypothetical protein D9M73_268190 [compost metagenome]